MSAWIVSKAHIDALVTAGLRDAEEVAGWPLAWRNGAAGGALGTQEDAERVGALLWAENIKSVNHRYRERTPHRLYRFERSRVTDPVVILKAIACYEYQTCEHDAWPKSEAHAFCEALRRAMIHRLPGYDAAPWGIEDAAPAVRS